MSPVSPVFHTLVTVNNWTQKRTQSESIHFIVLDVHFSKVEHQNFTYNAYAEVAKVESLHLKYNVEVSQC